jgi:cation:H+ antiporter
MTFVPDFIASLGLTHPATYLLLFLAASLLMIWRLEAMADHGLEGTALGTLVTPYCSGLGNLIFVFIVARGGGTPGEVMTNCLVNNVTNLTLILGLPALFWGLHVLAPAASAGFGKSKGKRPPAKAAKSGKADTERRISRLSLLLTMAAVAFFTGAVWALGRDGQLDLNDGLVLTGLFFFWQCFQVFDVLKHNVRQRVSFGAMFYLDLVLLLAGAALLYVSLDWLVSWLSSQKTGFINAKNLGWLSGWLMVLPNALLALWYGWKRRADVVYTSQIGDGHICVPLCLGLSALLKPVPVPAFFELSMILLLSVTAAHFLFVSVFGRLPQWAGAALIGVYGWFLYAGLIGG